MIIHLEHASGYELALWILVRLILSALSVRAWSGFHENPADVSAHVLQAADRLLCGSHIYVYSGYLPSFGDVNESFCCKTADQPNLAIYVRGIKQLILKLVRSSPVCLPRRHKASGTASCFVWNRCDAGADAKRQASAVGKMHFHLRIDLRCASRGSSIVRCLTARRPRDHGGLSCMWLGISKFCPLLRSMLGWKESGTFIWVS